MSGRLLPDVAELDRLVRTSQSVMAAGRRWLWTVSAADTEFLGERGVAFAGGGAFKQLLGLFGGEDGLRPV